MIKKCRRRFTAMFNELTQENEFELLHKKFITGLAWLRMYFETPRGRAEAARFEREVAGPIDEAWLKMTEAERQNHIVRWHNAGLKH